MHSPPLNNNRVTSLCLSPSSSNNLMAAAVRGSVMMWNLEGVFNGDDWMEDQSEMIAHNGYNIIIKFFVSFSIICY